MRIIGLLIMSVAFIFGVQSCIARARMEARRAPECQKLCAPYLIDYRHMSETQCVCSSSYIPDEDLK